jgi:hypothetical protein
MFSSPNIVFKHPLALIYCAKLGVSDQFCPGYATKNAVRIVDSFIPIPVTRCYNHTISAYTVTRYAVD